METFLNLLLVVLGVTVCVLISCRLWWSLVAWWTQWRQELRARHGRDE